ncbi:hypothetical protein [uncultured Tateyamaria sp.]|uniref:hypothetical protein n=1 Tax=uncultured Tateyamaria sp. TaxID=455651 RepID=UPI002625FCEB|nr:hypothetical protein [uncultured Tateyamaria sp.]
MIVEGATFGMPADRQHFKLWPTFIVISLLPFAVAAESGESAFRNETTLDRRALHQSSHVAPWSAVSLSSVQEIHVVEIDIGSLVRLIAEHHGLVPQVSNPVGGTVKNVHLQGGLEAMMTTLAQHSDIDWFVYDGTLSVTHLDETSTRFIPLNGLKFEDAEQLLAEADLDGAVRFRLRQIANGTAIRVSGPPRAVEVVEALVSLSTAEDAGAPTRNSIVIRRGTVKYVEIYGQAAVAQIGDDRQAEGGFDPPDPATRTGQHEATDSPDPQPSDN